MLGFLSINSEIVESSAIARLLARKNEITYYLITDATRSALKQIAYPVGGIFVVGPKSAFDSIQTENETCPHFSVHARTPNGVINQIKKLLPLIPEGKEYAFLIDDHLSFSNGSRLAFYRLLLESYTHVYLLDSTLKEQDDPSDFIEIFPDEKMLTLFDQVAEFAAREGKQ
jgi:hypothetical protein